MIIIFVDCLLFSQTSRVTEGRTDGNWCKYNLTDHRSAIDRKNPTTTAVFTTISRAQDQASKIAIAIVT